MLRTIVIDDNPENQKEELHFDYLVDENAKSTKTPSEEQYVVLNPTATKVNLLFLKMYKI